MYETFFGLTRRPFAAAPQVERYVPNHHSEQALATLNRSIERGEGPALIIGATGTGKTLLLHKLANTFVKQFRIAYLATARFSSPSALLQNILYELGRPYRGLDESELRLALTENLLDDEADERPLLLLADEAHTLSLRLLEEFRMITNQVRGGQPLVRLVLAGNARLEERFTNPKLDSLNQRIAARCYLESLNREDTTYYVREQLTRAGGNPDKILADDAYGAIYTATDGVPRLLNQVCDQALLLAAVAEHRPLDAACVEEAWADLQQLPTPWNREPLARQLPAAESSGVVEFGSLGGEEAAPVARPETPAKAASHTEPIAASAGQDQAVFSYDTAQAGDPTIELEQLHSSLHQLSEEIQQATVSGSFASSEQDEARFTSQFDEEEFQPAGFVGPEVELIFHAAHHPFGETFAEEEVVIDHYASIEKTATERRVHDQSGQGQEIAAVLKELPAQPDSSEASGPPALGIVADEDSDSSDLDDSPAVIKPAATDLTAIASEWEAAAGEAVLPDYRDEMPPAASAAAAEDRYQDDRLLASSDDRDIIIIEEERGGGSAVATQPTSRVRRQEYRQLFARLRRGG